MARFFTFRRPVTTHQRVFGFLERSRKLQRGFKSSILVVTILTIAGVLVGVPRGRNLTARMADAVRNSARSVVGLPVPREEIDAAVMRDRLLAIDDAARQFRKNFPDMEEPIQRLLRYAGSDPETGLLRWGNFDQTLLLPSTIFEPDDAGRSYRFRPNTRSIWVRNITPKKAPMTFFLVPDRPELAEVLQGTGGIIVTTSAQTTNSWGLRGPEPDPSAPMRGIVLGDSYMQGMFIDDDHTPPECLRRRLENQFKTKVSLLNTGHLGYSPEQYYHTLREYVDRFDPQFVIVSLFANDFGGIMEVARGKGDWDDGRYWMSEISQFCRTRQLLLLVVPAPLESQLNSQRYAGYYPGLISNILDVGSESYLDPIEEFVNRNIALVIEGDREGRRPMGSPLYNSPIGDGHFSPAGAEVWAQAVERRLSLLIEKSRNSKRPSPRETWAR